MERRSIGWIVRMGSVMALVIGLGFGFTLSGVGTATAQDATQTQTPPEEMSREEAEAAWVRALEEAGVVQRGAWFIAPEEGPEGRFSHCQMLIPYPLKSGERVILAVTLDAAGLALLQLSDPRGDFGTESYATIRLSVDSGEVLPLPGSTAGAVMIAELSDWPKFKDMFSQGAYIAMETGRHTRRLAVQTPGPALAALEECVQSAPSR